MIANDDNDTDECFRMELTERPTTWDGIRYPCNLREKGLTVWRPSIKLFLRSFLRAAAMLASKVPSNSMDFWVIAEPVDKFALTPIEDEEGNPRIDRRDSNHMEEWGMPDFERSAPTAPNSQVKSTSYMTFLWNSAASRHRLPRILEINQYA